MQIALHKNARTTPATRAEIAASKDSVSVLAKRYGVTEVTIRRRPHAGRCLSRASHTPHRLQTTLSVAQEHIAVELRRTLLLELDDLLAVMRGFVNERVSRSGLEQLPKSVKRFSDKSCGKKRLEQGSVSIETLPCSKPLPDPIWCGQPQPTQGAARQGGTQAFQGLCAGVCAH